MARRRKNTENSDQPKVKLTKENMKEALSIFSYVMPYKWSFFWGLVLLFLGSLVFMIFPFLAGEMVDIATKEATHDYNLKDIGLALVGVLVVQAIFSYIRVLLFANVSERSIADLRKDLYQRLIALPNAFFDENRIGALISRMTGDIAQLQSVFSITLAEFLRQIIILVVGLTWLAWLSWKLCLVMLGTVPVAVLGAMFFGRYVRKLSKQRQEELATTNTIVNETMQAITAVKSFTNELYEYTRYGRSIDKVVNTSLRMASVRGLLVVFIITVLFGGIFLVLWYGATLIENKELTVGAWVSFITVTAIIGGAIASLGSFYEQMVTAVGATERVRDILNQKPEINVTTQSFDKKIQLKGDIEFKDIHFSYPTRQDIEVLKGINFKVQAGQQVALVGSSGAGKSTIIQLLLRFYELNEGDILVDNKSLTAYDMTQYRSNVAIVPQEVILFGGTIRENIAYGKIKATEEELIEAAKKANAWDFIQGFPEGLDTIVGERGVKLSGGQRQRIAIARAILRDPAILILDEATSSLDAASERVVQDALNKLMKGRTSIVIAHRLATIREVDCIYVLNDGQIIESGTHSELSLKEEGAYANLAKLQFDLVE